MRVFFRAGIELGQLVDSFFKILVTGPVECRRGVLQLHPQNVKIIGGEVESLFKHHCVEAVINRKM